MDLWIACIVLVFLSVASFEVGRRVSAGHPHRRVALGLLVMTLIGAYLLWARDAAWILRLLPVSAAVIYANPLPWLTAMLAGVIWSQRSLPRWRRGVLAVAVIGFGSIGPMRALFNHPPDTRPWWQNGVAIQSAPATCSPAAAATLLSHYDIDTNERDMARLCLSTDKGTHLFGLYRGLSLMAREQNLEPIVLDVSLDELRDRSEWLPVIAGVRLTRDLHDRDPRYQQRWGWDVGVMHTLVILDFPDDEHVIVADPGAGLERWSLKGMRELWANEVIYLGKH